MHITPPPSPHTHASMLYVLLFYFWPRAQERKRVQAQYPDTKKLNDDEKLQELLTEARKKPQQDSDYWKAYSAD